MAPLTPSCHVFSLVKSRSAGLNRTVNRVEGVVPFPLPYSSCAPVFIHNGKHIVTVFLSHRFQASTSINLTTISTKRKKCRSTTDYPAIKSVTQSTDKPSTRHPGLVALRLSTSARADWEWLPFLTAGLCCDVVSDFRPNRNARSTNCNVSKNVPSTNH